MTKVIVHMPDETIKTFNSIEEWMHGNDPVKIIEWRIYEINKQIQELESEIKSKELSIDELKKEYYELNHKLEPHYKKLGILTDEQFEGWFHSGVIL